MQVLVTGGAGFIGSHLCESLLRHGHQVTALDNLITGHRENLQPFLERPDLRFLEQDVTLEIPKGPWDAIFHLASPASPVSYARYPLETLLANSQGTHRALSAARDTSAKFLLASTSEVYGDPQEHPQAESYWGHVNPVGPRACYDEGKRFAEAITMTYVREHGLNARIVRIFNTYGPRNHPHDGRLIPNFVTQALKGDPITVYGDGTQTRSLCYVSDLVEGLILALESSAAEGEVINLGNPQEHTVLEYAQRIKALTRSSSPIVHLPPREEEVARRRPDISKAQRLLRWQPATDLQEGLRQTIAWLKQAMP